MATVRRLSDDDVRTIFDCVYQNKLPPKNLHFRIVVVGPQGLKLSPPSIQFEDGLYILLRPQKKRRGTSRDYAADSPKIPPRLVNHVMREKPQAACPWSLSGPQFPQPTALQQRYCYPKGNPEYSSQKGGALWTRYHDNGKEDLEYRLLHVYYSAKRATNKGMKRPSTYSNDKTSPKKSKSDHTGTEESSFSSYALSPRLVPVNSSILSSPLSFEILPSPVENTVSTSSSDSVSFAPEKDIFESIHPIPLVGEDSNDSFGSTSQHYNHNHHHHHNHQHRRLGIYRPKPNHHYSHQDPMAYHQTPFDHRPYPTDLSPRRHTYGYEPSPQIHRSPQRQNKAHHMPPQESPSIEPCTSEMDTFSISEMDNFWTDNSFPDSSFPVQQSNREQSSACAQDRMKSFVTKLEDIHENMKEKILQSKDTDQGFMLTILSSWAKRIAQAPLGEITTSDTAVANVVGGSTNKPAFNQTTPPPPAKKEQTFVSV